MSHIYQALEQTCREKTSTGATPFSLQTEVVRGSRNAEMTNQMLANEGTILGVVLNKRRYFIPEFLYKKL